MQKVGSRYFESSFCFADIAKEDEQLKDPLGYGTVGYQMVAPHTKVIYNTRNPYVTYGRRCGNFSFVYQGTRTFSKGSSQCMKISMK